MPLCSFSLTEPTAGLDEVYVQKEGMSQKVDHPHILRSHPSVTGMVVIPETLQPQIVDI